MKHSMFEGDHLGHPVLGTLTYIENDVDKITVNKFHKALDNLTADTFPKKYEVISVTVTGRTYDGEIISILKCDKIFDNNNIEGFEHFTEDDLNALF